MHMENYVKDACRGPNILPLQSVQLMHACGEIMRGRTRVRSILVLQVFDSC
jgi:hypothetical protein